MAEYDRCLKREAPKAKAPQPRLAEAGTFATLTNAYLASGDLKVPDASTQGWQLRALLQICNEHGSKRASMLQARHVRRLRDGKRDTQAAGRAGLADSAMALLPEWRSATQKVPPEESVSGQVGPMSEKAERAPLLRKALARPAGIEPAFSA